MSRTAIPLKTQKTLLLLSGNECCHPDCRIKLYSKRTKTLLAEFCHIHAVSPDGPRFDPNLLPDELNSIENLIVLCPNHHKEIDSNLDRYTAEILKKMREEHELKFYREEATFTEEGEEIPLTTEDLENLGIEIEPLDVKINIQKKDYPKVPNYLAREINPVIKSTAVTEKKTLVEIIKTVKRLTLLGFAGSGKSIELENLAYHYSNPTEEFYPVKIRLNLLSTEQIEYFLKIEFPDYDKVPQNKLLIILDALDEVHADYIDIVSNKIAVLGKILPASTIVVSCRNNFYITENEKRTSKIEGFSTYSLEPLSYHEIYKYVNYILGDSVDFFNKINNIKLFDLLYSPFYLVNLLAYYKTKKDIPKNKKEIFEYLILERLSTDQEKFRNTGAKISSYVLEIEENIEKLALYSLSLGRNYLVEKTEFQKIISDKKILEILKHTFLFSKNNFDNWQFEHNNFQEYLAAKCLSKLNFAQIKTFISFPTEYKKIKPNWLNTLSFLFSILDISSETFRNLVQWLESIEPDVLVRFEKDKIDIRVRESIFKSIYENYTNKKIRIGNEKFGIADLATFASDCDSILEFLIGKLKTEKEDLLISDTVLVLKYFNNIDKYKEEITKVLLEHINGNLNPQTKYNCLCELSLLGISSPDITKRILESLDLDSNTYLRTGFYNYIYKSPEIENHLDIFLKGVEHITKSERGIAGNGGNEVHLFDEKNTLTEIFQTINKKENIISILRRYCSYNGYDTFNFEILGFTLKKAQMLYAAGETILYQEVFDLLVAFSKKHYKDIKKDLAEFFESTGTSFNAYQKLYKTWIESKENSYEWLGGIITIMTNQIMEDLLKKVKNGELDDNQVSYIRNMLGYDGSREFHDKFYNELIHLYGSKFKYLENNFELRKKERLVKDFELLFNEKDFLKEAKRIFDAEGKTSITFDELYEYKKAHFNDDNLDNNIVLDTLRNWATDTKLINLSKVEDIVSDPTRWEWFKLHKLVYYDTQIDDFEFNETAKIYIKKWVIENLEKANFYTALEVKEDGRRHYRYLELYIPYFVKRLEIDVSQETYLSFLFVDCDLIPYKKEKEAENKKKPFYRYIIDKTGVESVKQQVLKNLKNPSLTLQVAREHYNFCEEYNFTECIDTLLLDISRREFSNYERIDKIDLYFKLKGDIKNMEALLDIFEEEVNTHLITKLIESRSIIIHNYCSNKLKSSENEDAKLLYINFLLKINLSASFNLLKDWVLRNKKFPYRSFNSGDLKEENYSDLVEIYEASLLYNFQYAEHNGSVYLSEIIRLGSSCERLYVLTKDRFLHWINRFSDAKYLYYHIQKLEQIYYSNKHQAISLEEIEALLKSQKKHNPLIAFWEKNKTVIEIILAVVGLIGLVISIKELCK